MRIIDLMFKDLLQILRDKKALLFLVAMPIAFTFFMGLTFKGQSSPQDNRITVGWINHDDPAGFGSQLITRLENSDSLRLVALSDTEMQSKSIVAVLVIPEGFGVSMVKGDPKPLQLSASAETTDVQSVQKVLDTVTRQLLGSAQAASLDVSYLQSRGVQVDQSAEALTVLNQVWSKWDAIHNNQLISLELAGEKPVSGIDLKGNPYNQTSPGILVQFAIFGLVTSATVVFQERKTRTLQRMITTSLPASGILVGHFLAIFTLVMLQIILLVVFGQFILKVDYFANPLATLLVSIGLSAWVGCMGLVVGVIAKGEEQVILYSLIGMFLFTALGGAWFPIEGSNGLFAAIGRLTPAAWAMQGYQNILLRGLGLDSALLPLAALIGYGLLFFLIAVWRFRSMDS